MKDTKWGQFKEKYLSEGFLKKAALVLAGAGLLLLCGSFLSGGGESVDTGYAAQEAYVQALEHKVTQVVSQLEGVGRVRVMISLEAGSSALYTLNRTWTGGSETGELPAVQGAVIVCDGAGNAGVRSQLTELISVILNIGYDKIAIVQMSGE